jgi:hypothetical protein
VLETTTLWLKASVGNPVSGSAGKTSDSRGEWPSGDKWCGGTDEAACNSDGCGGHDGPVSEGSGGTSFPPAPRSNDPSET